MRLPRIRLCWQCVRSPGLKCVLRLCHRLGVMGELPPLCKKWHAFPIQARSLCSSCAIAFGRQLPRR